MTTEQTPDRGFRISEDGAPFTVSGNEEVQVSRRRHIAVDRYPHSQTQFSCAVYQHSDYRGDLIDPPFVYAAFDRMTREEWARFKREVDRAFDEFDKRWPAEHPIMRQIRSDAAPR